MRINLNNPDQFTLEGIRALIRSMDDSKHAQIRIERNGDVYLSRIVGSAQTADLYAYFETFAAGNDLVGEEAAKDDKWVNRIYHALKENWPKLKYDKYIDTF